MVETKANPSPSGCLAKALPDEPMFILLARDKAAPDTIRVWSDLRAKIGIEEEDSQDAEQLTEALETADEFEAWRRDNEGAWRGVESSPFELPSEKATTLAGSMINYDPLDDPHVVGDIWPECVEAMKRQLAPYIKNTQSLAGALLRLDPKAGQDGQ